MKKQSLATKVSDFFIVFACVWCILVLLLVLKGATSYWITAFNGVLDFNGKMFWIGLFCSIVYALYNFIVGFVKEIARTIRRYK